VVGVNAVELHAACRAHLAQAAVHVDAASALADCPDDARQRVHAARVCLLSAEWVLDEIQDGARE
jgi:hypothetical protein